jgi:Tat protein secretion system quality control protein TatD with DNase activity
MANKMKLAKSYRVCQINNMTNEKIILLETDRRYDAAQLYSDCVTNEIQLIRIIMQRFSRTAKQQEARIKYHTRENKQNYFVVEAVLSDGTIEDRTTAFMSKSFR